MSRPPSDLRAASDPRRAIPGVDSVLARPWCRDLAAQHGISWVGTRLRAVLDRLRSGREPIPSTDEGLAELVRAEVARASAPSLQSVINATGVVLHTNLGRAPLAAEARDAMAAAAGYANLEFDLASGERGSRYDHCVGLLTELTGAEDALVVNNGAGALALALAALAGGQGVVVSHGELVEIGGGFRIPEVVEAAGARLAPVGTTNRTRLADYARAVEGGGVGAILKVHRSNFRVTGFTSEASLLELAALGAQTGVPVIYDLGSGLLVDPTKLGLPPEPTASEGVSAGLDVVAFSGDKLLGGPQAGVLAGKREAVSKARSHPLCRALRSDKVTLAGLEATLALYRDPERAGEHVPALRMIATPAAELERRAKAMLDQLRALQQDERAPTLHAAVEPGESLVGGGTFPGVGIPTALLVIRTGDATATWLAALRSHDPAVVARGRKGRVVLDLRTVAPHQDAALAAALASALASAANGLG